MFELLLGAVLLICAWLAWTRLPDPANVVVGILLGIVGAYLVIVGLVDLTDNGRGLDNGRDGAAVGPVAWLGWKARECLR